MFPKFLWLKLYRRSLENTDFYNNWRSQLLDYEIKHHKKELAKLNVKLLRLKINLRNSVSFLDYSLLLHFIHINVRKYSSKVKQVHNNNLLSLGEQSKLKSCDPDKVIHNFFNLLIEPSHNVRNFCFPSTLSSVYRLPNQIILNTILVMRRWLPF